MYACSEGSGKAPKGRQKGQGGKALLTVEAEDPAPTVPTPPVDQHDAKLEMQHIKQKFDQLIKNMKQDETQSSQHNNKMVKAITELTVAAGQNQVGKATPYGKQNNARDVQQGNHTAHNIRSTAMKGPLPDCGSNQMVHVVSDAVEMDILPEIVGQVQMSSQSGQPTQGAATNSHSNLQGSYQRAGDGSNQA